MLAHLKEFIMKEIVAAEHDKLVNVLIAEQMFINTYPKAAAAAREVQEEVQNENREERRLLIINSEYCSSDSPIKINKRIHTHLL